MQLTQSVSTQAVRERIGVGEDEQLRESDKRRQYLQKFGRIVTPERPTVHMSQAIPTAACDQQQDEPHIQMTTRRFDQPVTEFDTKTYDMIMQEALMIHELGHVLYTDDEKFRDVLSRVDLDKKSMFKRVWNTLEDGAIERQLRHRYDVGEEIEVMNANLFENEEHGHDNIGDDVERFSLYQAIVLGFTDMAVYDSGRFGDLLDPANDDLMMASKRDQDLLRGFVSDMQMFVKAVLTEPDADTRTEVIYNAWISVKELMDESDVGGENEDTLNDLINSDGSIGGEDGDSDEDSEETDPEASDGTNAPMQGKPDDSDNQLGDESRDANELSREDVQEEIEQQLQSVVEELAESDEDVDLEEVPTGAGSGAEDDENADDGDAEAQAGGAGGQEGEETEVDQQPAGGGSASDTDADSDADFPGSGSVPGEGLQSDDADADDGDAAGGGKDLEEDMRQQLRAESEVLEDGESLTEEIEDYLEIIQGVDSAGDGFRGLQMDVPQRDPDNWHSSRWADTQASASRLAKTLRNRLLEQERDKVRRNKRRGDFDRGQMVNASRGQTNVFQQTEEGEQKDYTCMLILDRSGSMGSNGIMPAEEATVKLGLALEEVGVDVTIFDLYNSEARLVKPEASSMRDARQRLMNGSNGGGTPMSEVVHIVRNKLREEKNPFALVVTDGRPADGQTYREELDKMTCPVLGIYMTDDRSHHEEDTSLFHGISFVTDNEDLDSSLKDLATQVMF